MKHLACGLFLFALGLLIGAAGSDDSLLQEAWQRESAAYARGYAEALSRFQALAVQIGFAHWNHNPHTGLPDQFTWTLPNGFDNEALPALTTTPAALTNRPEPQPPLSP